MSAVARSAVLQPPDTRGAFVIAAAAGLFVCGLLSVTAGLILHSIARRSQEFEYHMRVLADELRAGRGAPRDPAARDDGGTLRGGG